MKPVRRNPSLLSLSAIFLSWSSLALESARATTLYWDTNGTTAGSGAATGTWDTSTTANWTTDSTGVAAPGALTTSTLDNLFFSAGTNGTIGTVTVSGTQAANLITFDDNVAVTISGGTQINLGTTGSTTAGITVANGDNAANAINTAIALGVNSTVTNNGTGTLTLGGVISGSGFSLTKAGAGTLTLSGANTYTGGTTINGGAVSVGADNNLGTSASGVTLNGGALQYTAGVTNSHVITVGSNGGTIKLTNNSNSSLGTSTGLLTGNGNLTVMGTGGISNLANASNNRLTFGANYSGFTGGLTIRDGAIAEVNANTITGGAITVGANGLFALNGSLTFTQALTVNDRGILGFNGTSSTYGGNITVNGTSGVRLQNWWQNTTQNGTISGNISGTGGLKVETGSNSGATLTLSGTNSYSGNTTITASTVAITGNSTALSGTFNVGVDRALNTTAGTLTLNGNTGSLASNAKVNGSGGTFNYQGATAGSTLNAAGYTFTGDTTIQSTYGTSGNTSITLAGTAARTAGSTLNLNTSGGTTGTTNKIIFSSAPATGTLLNKGIFFGGGNYAAYDVGGFARAYGSGDTDYALSTGGTTFGATSSTSNVDLTTAAVTAQMTTQINTLRLGTTFGVAMTAANTLTVDGILKSGGNAATISSGNIQASSGGELVIRTNASGDSLTISSVIANNGGSSLTKSGLGSLTLSGANTYTGGSTLSGGTVNLGASSTGSAGAVTNGPLGTGKVTLNGVILSSNGGGDRTLHNDIEAAAGSINMIGAVTGSGNVDLFGAMTGTGTIENSNTGSAATVRFRGDLSGFQGTFNLFTNSQTNVRIGNVSTSTVDGSQATWVLSGFGTGKNVAVNDSLSNVTVKMGSLSGDGIYQGSFNGGLTSLEVGALNTDTKFAGYLSNSASSNQANINLTKVGAGSFTLSNSGNLYTGTTTVQNGSLIAEGNAPSGSAGVFGNASSAIVLGDATTISSATAMNPKLLAGNGVTVARNLTVGANATTPTHGGTTFALGGSSAGAATFSGTTTLNQNLSVTQVSGGTLNLTGNITSGSAGTQTVTFNNVGSVSQSTGVIGGGTGTIAFTQSGTGTTTLSGANTYTGATTINAGTLVINGNQSAATGAVGVSNAGTRLIGIGTIGGNTIINTGAIHSAGGAIANVDKVGKQIFDSGAPTTNVTYGSGSIFEWDLIVNKSTAGYDHDSNGETPNTNVGTRGIDFDAVDVSGTLTVGSDAIFRVVLGTGVVADSFWQSAQSWTDIFSGTSSGAFSTSYLEVVNSAGATYDPNTLNPGYGFAINGSNLTWSAVPEPTSALAGVLIGAGLLRRRRK